MKIIKFETKSCTPCKMVDMMMNSLNLSADERVDIAENEELRNRYDIMQAPTLMLIDEDGREIDRVLGINEELTVDLFKKAGKLN